MHLRKIILATGAISLICAILGGVVRLGINFPVINVLFSTLHAPLLLCGFLGTLIGLERAVALGNWWAYLAPILTGIGSILIIVFSLVSTGQYLITAGAIVMVMSAIKVIKIQPALYTFILGAGALCFFIGCLAWARGQLICYIVYWWGAFLVLTILGERLELSRLRNISFFAKGIFVLSTLLYFVGIVLAYSELIAGVYMVSAGMVCFALWLFKNDIARWTIRKEGMPRFVSVCLLAGFAWLGISGVLMALNAGMTSGMRYDAVLHSLFLGFVFSMIFGHAPIIFPSITGVTFGFSRLFYAHLIVLHASLIVRIGADEIGSQRWREIGSLGNILSILLFFANTIYAVRAAISKAKKSESKSKIINS